ncbi:hypothetical protein [Hasllibacter sp. MH4015]|uniref:hypothetical protein n=1 Tax=Hasllibacter sp. MH4015 TaxID=2854029 RepID=UPI001CD3D4DF|nr:hypothetical protein [Hasllibacter sp. MH4015]
MIAFLALLTMGLGLVAMLPDGEDEMMSATEEEGADADLGSDLLPYDADGQDLLDSIDPPLTTDSSVNDLETGELPITGDAQLEDILDGSEAMDPVVDPGGSVGDATYEVELDVNEFDIVDLTGDDSDLLSGGAGGDLLVGTSGSEEISGNSGNDFIHGGGGTDTLLGGDGDDTLISLHHPHFSDASEPARLVGGSGDDVLVAEDGDILVGGEGNDLFNVFSDEITESDVAEIEDFEIGKDRILLEIRDNLLGGTLDYTLSVDETGVTVSVDGTPVALLKGVSTTEGLDIEVRSVGH